MTRPEATTPAVRPIVVRSTDRAITLTDTLTVNIRKEPTP